MWCEGYYDTAGYDTYEAAFEIADFERRLKRERQFDDYDLVDNEEQSTVLGNLFNNLKVSLFVSQDGIVKLNIFLNKIF